MTNKKDPEAGLFLFESECSSKNRFNLPLTGDFQQIHIYLRS